MRIVLELKADASSEAVMAYLYKHTALQTNFNVNLTCLVPTANPVVGQPARVTLRDLCRHFLDFRMVVVTRRLEHEQRQLEARIHILDGSRRSSTPSTAPSRSSARPSRAPTPPRS